MPRVGQSGNTGIVPPYIRDNIEAQKLQSTLVLLNKRGRIGQRTINFKIGRKPVQTDEAIRALKAGKDVRATVMEFKRIGGSKMTGDSGYRGKVRVAGIKIATLNSVQEAAAFAKANVFDFNKKAASDA